MANVRACEFCRNDIPKAQLTAWPSRRFCDRRCYEASQREKPTLKKTNEAEYRAWCHMKTRCSLPSVDRFPLYGGRGIRVCDRWLESFSNFLADMGPRPSSRHSIEREDVDGNYEPSNCRWATRVEQARNKSNNRLLTHNGVTRCLTEWALVAGMSPTRVLARLNRGWSVADALFRPKRRTKQTLPHGETAFERRRKAA